MVQSLVSSGETKPVVSVGDYGVAIYRATADTPTHPITPRAHLGDWGSNPFAGHAMPWDPGWRVPSGSDGWTVVIRTDGIAVECWRTQVHDGQPSCEWGAVTDTRKSSVPLAGAPTGAGLSRLAGVITQADWKRGRIDHALTFGAPDNDAEFVYPAVRTDGEGDGQWSEGQYIWWDKNCTADTSGLSRAQRMVIQALRDYGAYDVDNAATFGFASQHDARIPGHTRGDGYLSLRNVPFEKCLRVGSTSGKRNSLSYLWRYPDKKFPIRSMANSRSSAWGSVTMRK